MAYRIAGIDVHKRKLAVVVADVEVEEEYQFEQRWYLKMALEEVQLIEQQIGQLDQEIASLLRQHQDAVERLAEVPVDLDHFASRRSS